MSSAQHHPKFLMQVNREQPVPKLISINDYTTTSLSGHKRDRLSRTKNPSSQQKNTSKYLPSENRQQPFAQASRSNAFYDSQSQANYNTFTTQGQNMSVAQNDPTQPSIFYTTARKQLPVTEARNYRLEVIQLQKLLEIERQQKLQLQQIIKQLTVQSEKLKQVNEHIVDRLKDLERNFVDEKTNQQKEQDQRVRKVISQVYRDIEEFIRAEVQTLTNKLKGERMSPLLEKKLELFMESLLQINQNTVEMFKISQKQYSFPPDPLASFIKDVYPNDKENIVASEFSRQLNVMFDSKSKNESFLSRSSNRGEKSSPARSGKRLINKAYISSNRKQSPSRVLFDTGSKLESFVKENNQDLLYENHFQNNQIETFRDNFHKQKMDEIPSDHISFINPFNTNHFETHNRNNRMKTVEDSNISRRQYFETSNYDQNGFHIKEYTPNKRKKIFGDLQAKSNSKNYEKTYQNW